MEGERSEMEGKIVFITGVTSGIGKETAHELARLGATIIGTTRDAKKGEQTKQELIQTTNNKNIEVLFCDLASFVSIRTCCSEFLEKYDTLHVLINNAGTWDYHRRESKDGIENIFATNYLAPFLLTNLLLPVLKKSAPSRIINLTSGLHSGTIHFDDLEFKKNFSGMKAYAHSKLALILFTRLFAKKLEGTGVTINCVNPGMTKTKLGRDAGFLSQKIFILLGKNIVKGAETSVHLASSPEVEKTNGEYFEKKAVKQTNEETYDMDAAEKLWGISKKYVGL
jgi:NAD(P)-dependent dehydrogenase (short-subunit alcohol dehydrogenase family)